MKVDVLMPKMGESITEGKILSWAKSKGDKVEKDETILEISTDKVDTEVPSPETGTIVEVFAAEGDTLDVGAKLATIETDGDAAESAPSEEEEPAEKEEKGEKEEKPEKEEKSGKKEKPKASKDEDAEKEIQENDADEEESDDDDDEAPAPKKPREKSEGKRFYSPVVMRIASDEGIEMDELEEIDGSGANGRVTKKDILDYMETRGESAPAKKEKDAGETKAPAARSVEPAKKAPGDDVEVVPMDNIKRLMAEHMVKSVDISPHVTLVAEVDMTNIVNFRKKHGSAFKSREGISLTFMPFIAEAAVKALKEFPYMNSSIDGTDILVKRNVGLGIAVAMANGGLIVPVIKGADTMNLSGLAHSIHDIATRARNKRLQPDEIQGGTFTITNFGVFGSTFGTPIINQPQVGILGVGTIAKRPVVIEAEGEDVIAIRSIMMLSITFDHRLIDGAYGGQYLEAMKKHLDNFNQDSI